MSMPGFFAEASLGVTGPVFRLGAVDKPNGMEVIPQAYSPRSARNVCWVGNIWLDPSAGLHYTVYCGGIAVFEH